MISRIRAAALALVLAAAPARAADLIVHVTNLRNDRGHVLVGLYDSAATWLDDQKSLRDLSVPASRAGVTVTFRNLPPGLYGIGTMHDERDLGTMAFDALGLPEEGYAFSRNVRPFLAAPSFGSAAVRVGATDVEISIRMVYP